MCGGPKWKRERVQDHKFDFVNVTDFVDNGFMMRMKYLWLYIIVLKSFLVYVSDVFTATTMLSTSAWSNEIFNECEGSRKCIFIPFNTGKWLFVGCIIFGFLLLAYESRKAKKIIASRDISFAFTNVMANNYYSLRSYPHFCFFDHISNSTKLSDDFAFFIFFTFKSWKRVLLADGPRQTINALTLYAIYVAKRDPKKDWYDPSQYFSKSVSTSALTVTTFFTVVVFLGSLLLLVVAGVCYIPLLLHIRGNLKEYCCHQVDKRIETVIKRNRKNRVDKETRDRDFGNNKNGKALPQPTLPKLTVDDDIDDAASIRTRGPPPSTYTQDYYSSDNGSNYLPPMPGYNPYSNHPTPGAWYNPSQSTIVQDEPASTVPRYRSDDDNESTAHLAAAAAPFAYQPPIDRPGSANPYSHPNPQPITYDPHDVYSGRTAQYPMRRPSPVGGQQPRPSSGLAYDDASEDHYAQQQQQQHYYGASMRQVNDNPYLNYSNGYPTVPQSSTPQPWRGRRYDEENRGGGYAM
ncbi:hypothetical protein AX16_000252 [Volvariella volvacea WC 439]|nr:hypothetical protein AX16_000252 [Volvariella volvacea WC 439]